MISIFPIKKWGNEKVRGKKGKKEIRHLRQNKLRSSSLKSGEQMEEVYSNLPLVIDNGSGSIKAGLAGETQPQLVIPSVYGECKYEKVMVGGVEELSFVGRGVEKYRGLCRLSYPIENGIIKDWDKM